MSKAIQNGLRFCNRFLQKYFSADALEYPLGTVQTPRWELLPETQRGPRKIYVQKNAKQTNVPPLIAESVIRRMRDDSHYRPEAIRKLREFRVLKENSEIENYSNQRVLQLWDSLQQPTNKMAKVLRFSKSQSSSSAMPHPEQASQSEVYRKKLRSAKK